MKILLALLFSISSCMGIFAQNIDLGKLEEEKRNEYLIQIGKDVTKQFGPGYYREYKQPVISMAEKFYSDDKRPEIVNNIGREYYTITFLYDKSKETLDFDFASEVKIWKDTGEPFEVIFGNGYGKNFLFISYKQLKTIGVEPMDQIPYQQIAIPNTNIGIESSKEYC